MNTNETQSIAVTLTYQLGNWSIAEKWSGTVFANRPEQFLQIVRNGFSKSRLHIKVMWLSGRAH